jgi:hypothetical protein
MPADEGDELPERLGARELCEVFATDSVREMLGVQLLLDQAGIATVAGSLGDSPWGSSVYESRRMPAVGFAVWTRAEDVDDAGALVDRYRRGEIALPQPAPWKCPRCGETIEGQFTQCWSCTLETDYDPRLDPEARCDCGYLLWGLPHRRCPECGETF